MVAGSNAGTSRPSSEGLSAPAHKAAMAVISRQGPSRSIDASPTRIGRMLLSIYDHERDIRAWEDMKNSKGRRYVMCPDGKLRWRPVRELVGDSLKEARQKRDEHIEDVRHVIDYALTEDLYERIPCPDCKLPADALAFVARVADFEPVDDCKTCSNSGAVRVKKSDSKSQKAHKRISYFKRVIDDVIDAAKVRAGTSDRDEAYLRLESRNRNLLVKFGNERQTSMEGGDAEQGVRLGIMDAARRFDPTLPNMASFNTVAYMWCYRNSRARHDWQKRAGVYAPSVEAMGTDEEGNGMAAMVTDTFGACGTFGGTSTCTRNLRMDVAEQVQALPAEEKAIIALEMTGHTVTQISKETGLSPVKVRRLRKAAFEKLREGLVGYALRE